MIVAVYQWLIIEILVGNINSAQYTCRGGFLYCYIFVGPKDECPYKDYVPFANTLIDLPKLNPLIVPVRRDKENGYFKSTDISSYYDSILESSRYNVQDAEGECILNDLQSSTIKQMVCDGLTKVCFYSKHAKLTFCESYNDTCSTVGRTNCGCFSNRFTSFFCAESCVNNGTVSKDCENCDKKFDEHGYPKLTLQVEGRDIFLTVENQQKLQKIPHLESQSLSSVPMVCYAESSRTTFDVASTKQKESFIYKKIENYRKKEKYQLSPLPSERFGTGKFWCLGFVYPNLEVVRSNTVFYKDPDYNFAFTANISNSFDKFQNPYTNIKHEFTNLRINGYVKAIDFYKPNEATIYIVGNFSSSYSNLNEAYLYLKSSLTWIPISDIVNIEYCLRTEEFNATSNITWSQTYIGQTVPTLEMCLSDNGRPVVRKCAGEMGKGAYWEPPVGTCASIKLASLTQSLLDLLHSNKSANLLTEELHDIINAHQANIQYQDVYIISQIIETIASSPEMYDLETLINTISDIMDFEVDVLQLSQEVLNATDKILDALDAVLTNYANYFVEDELTIVSPNLNVHILNIKEEKISGIAFYKTDRIEVLNDVTKFVPLEDDDLMFLAIIPERLLEQILENEKLKEVYFVTAAIKKYTLFNSPRENIKITGWIPSIFVTGFHKKFLKSALTIFMRPHRRYRYKSFCSYWKYGRDEMLVSVDGIWAKEFPPRAWKDYSVCSFRHMTHFALLLDLPTTEILNIFSVVGSSVSLVAIFAIYMTAIVSRKWRDSDGANISLSSCTTVVLQIVLLAVAQNVDSYEQETLCVIIGACLHYSIISQFFWMLVIGFLQYRKFIVVFTKNSKHIQIISLVVGWFLPIVPILLTLVYTYESYIKDQYCYLTDEGLYWGVFLPVSLVIVFNIFIFVRIFVELGKRKQVRTCTNIEKEYALFARLSVFLFFVLGLNWIFGLLNGFFQKIALSYVYCFTASLQGVVLFWYYVIFNQDAIQAWKRIFQRRSSLFDFNTSSSNIQKSSTTK